MRTDFSPSLAFEGYLHQGVPTPWKIADTLRLTPRGWREVLFPSLVGRRQTRKGKHTFSQKNAHRRIAARPAARSQKGLRGVGLGGCDQKGSNR